MQIADIHDGSRLIAIVDDNGDTAYLYLLQGAEIVGDVWLYNHGQAPVEPEWNDLELAPFKNPREFISDEQFEPIRDRSEVKFDWQEESGICSVDLYVRGLRIASLTPGLRPGYSSFVVKDGPLALRLV